MQAFHELELQPSFRRNEVPEQLQFQYFRPHSDPIHLCDSLREQSKT